MSRDMRIGAVSTMRRRAVSTRRETRRARPLRTNVSGSSASAWTMEICSGSDTGGGTPESYVIHGQDVFNRAGARRRRLAGLSGLKIYAAFDTFLIMASL